MGRQRSIVLVTVDCLRADHVGFMGYKRPTTPFLDSLSGESLIVPNAIVAGAPTYYSFPAILASRFPLALGRDALGVGPEEPTLAAVLQEAGYATGAFVAANPYISASFGYERGFDTFRDFLEADPVPLADAQSSPQGAGWASRINRGLQRIRPLLGPLGSAYDELYFQYCQRAIPVPDSLDCLRRFPAANELVDEAIKWIEKAGDDPVFLWLHLMDPHSPYCPKQEAIAMMGDDSLTPFRVRYLNSYWNRSDLGPRGLARQRDAIVCLYDAGIRWVDAQMERLAQGLRKSDRWQDCIFAVTADHGEEFLEHGGRYHAPSRLTEELIHVPLLLRVPGAQKEKVSEAPFSMIHLAPTLLDAAAVPAPAEFHGKSQWRQLQSGEDFNGGAISECVAACTNPFRRENRIGARVLSVRSARFKLVLHFDPVAEEFYDLEADPEEKFALAPSVAKAERGHLLEIARDHLQRSVRERDRNTRLQVQLRDLQLEWRKPARKASPAAH